MTRITKQANPKRRFVEDDLIAKEISNQSQQPEVLTCQGEGKIAERDNISSGYLETGKSKEYSSADTHNKIPQEIEVLDYSIKPEEICSKCGFIQEAHINRGISYNCYKDYQGKFHWKPCKKFKAGQKQERDDVLK
jgi:hypothetical protein